MVIKRFLNNNKILKRTSCLEVSSIPSLQICIMNQSRIILKPQTGAYSCSTWCIWGCLINGVCAAHGILAYLPGSHMLLLSRMSEKGPYFKSIIGLFEEESRNGNKV